MEVVVEEEWESPVERAIREAAARGEFDDLPIRLFNLKTPIVSTQRALLDATAEPARLAIPADIVEMAEVAPGEASTVGPETERGRLQDALYRLIQGREKMPLSPGWHNARRKTIFRYIDRLRGDSTP